MKKLLTLLILTTLTVATKAQTKAGVSEIALTDSICNCLNKVDMETIKGKADATAAFTTCFAKYTSLLMAVADERHVDPTDKDAMRQVGIEVGKNLFKQNCEAFTQISLKMASDKSDDEENGGSTTGVFKRIDVKGFYYLILSVDGSERSYLWLKRFPASEKFIGLTTKYIGKKMKVSWQEVEVYLPQAKGYYKVKEITSIVLL